ncbi:MAG: hypothetical protein IKH38_02405 [Clostridia bacterium]|nr:hypothetical protein [Clostridia bacterium]
MRYPNAAKGIKKIYLAEILGIVAAVFGIGILVLTAVRNVDLSAGGDALRTNMESAGIVTQFVIYGIAAILLVLVSYFLGIAGILQASKDEESFKRALWVELLGLALTIVIAYLQNSSPRIASWLNIAVTVCAMTVTLLVLEGICRLAESLGRKDITALAEQSRKYLLIAYLLSAVGELFVALNPGDPFYVSASGVAAFLMDIAAYVLYLRVLSRAKTMQ